MITRLFEYADYRRILGQKGASPFLAKAIGGLDVWDYGTGTATRTAGKTSTLLFKASSLRATAIS